MPRTQTSCLLGTELRFAALSPEPRVQKALAAAQTLKCFYLSLGFLFPSPFLLCFLPFLLFASSGQAYQLS